MATSRPAAKRGIASIVLGVPLALLHLAAACAGTPEREAPRHVREIDARNRHLEEQFRSGNLLGVADVYADDAVLVDASGERTTGRMDIDAYWSAIEQPVDWRLDVREIRGSDAIAYELGTSHLTVRRGGELATSVADFLLVWTRDESGAWVIELDAYWPAAE